MEKHERRAEPLDIPKTDWDMCEQPLSVTVTLTFRRPEHEQELKEALNGGEAMGLIWDLDQWLRSEVKHGEDELKARYYQQVRERVWEMLDERGLSLE